MKNPPTLMRLGAILAVGFGLAMVADLRAQSVTTTTKEVTSDGTISSFEPQSFVIKSEAAPGPLTYSYSTTTRYLDDSGATITRETIRPGVPVTVYYTREGDRLTADRVIVHKTTTTAAETTTRTTTTTTQQAPLTKEEAKRERKHEKELREHPERESRKEDERSAAAPPARQVTTTETTTSDGTISTFAPDQFVVKSTTDENPVTYRYSKTTTYVDDEGNPVTMDGVRAGLPVTVHYIHQGDGFVAQRVIVHRRGLPAPRALLPP